MQVSNTFSGAAIAALQTKSSTERAGGADFLEEMERADSDPVAAVFANYDLQNISPLEIDQMVEELHGAGHPFDQDLLMLSSRGAAFRSHLSEMMGGDYDGNQRVNLIAQTQDQLVMARRYGDPTEALEDFLEFLNAADQRQLLDAEKTQQRLLHENMMRQVIAASGDAI